jgi:hypothetical protein
VWGTDTPKDRDEVNKKELCEYDVCVCDLDVIGTPSTIRLIHSSATLLRMLPIFDLSGRLHNVNS